MLVSIHTDELLVFLETGLQRDIQLDPTLAFRAALVDATRLCLTSTPILTRLVRRHHNDETRSLQREQIENGE